ncbi:MAG: hypothetical protein AMXMBFR7_50920 [Planctomycetota bacterium]
MTPSENVPAKSVSPLGIVVETSSQHLKSLRKYRLEVGRFTVPYAVAGREGPVLLAINGLQQSMVSWFSVLKYFTRHTNLCMVLLDLPGQGRAQIDSGPPEVSFEEHMAVLRAVATQVAPDDQIRLIGGSWGGVLSAAYAASFPEHVSKLVLGSFRTKPNATLLRILTKGQQLFEANRLDEVAALLIEGFGENLSESKKAQMRQQFTVISMDHLRHLYAQTFAFQACKDISEYVDLHAIRAETLIVNGANDPIVDLQDTREAASRIPNCRYRIIPDVGHFLHTEKPDVLDVYREFLNEP